MVSRREVYRYLGCRGAEPDERTSALVEECIAKVKKEAKPRHSMRRVALTGRDAECGALDVGGMKIKSRDLSRNLKDCKEAVMFAATLGADVDRMIRRAGVAGALELSVTQAVSAAVIEEYCDEINEKINAMAKAEGLFTRPRYSPGFGDFDLKHQEEFLSMLDASKRLGITLTEGFLMVPSKSVTALVGLSEIPREKRK
jgi:hypothetical protein